MIIILLIIIFVMMIIYSSDKKCQDKLANKTKELDKIVILYINLQESIDRKKHIENEIKKFIGTNQSIKYERIDGIKKSPGALGCLMSHIKALEYGYIKYPSYHVLIVEDDFTFLINEKEMNEYLEKISDINWDVVVLGQYVYDWAPIKDKPSIMRLYYSSSTSGYLVKNDYIPTLYHFWKQHYDQVKNKKQFNHNDHLDQAQKQLQEIHIWLGRITPMGTQKQNHSLITNEIAHNTWQATSDLQSWIDSDGNIHPLHLRDIEIL